MMSTTNSRLRVLVAGGYGYFGTLIAAALADDPGVSVIVAGRNSERARHTAERLGCEHAALDTGAMNLEPELARAHVDLVVDATGAFTGTDYQLARAALAAGASYIDISDSRRHVCNISKLDAQARDRGLLVVAGASSVPTLSAAVIDAHLAEFAELHRVAYGISASELTPGNAAVTSVLGYCGRSIPGYDKARHVTRTGWQGSRLIRFNKPLGRRWLARCDVPDLSLFPERYPTLRSMEFRAGVAMLPSMMGLWVLSWLVRLRLLRSAAPFSERLRRWAGWLEPLGAGRSGMYVAMSGVDKRSRPLHRSWQLIATHNHGPRVAAMGAVALVRKIVRCGLPASGAFAGAADLITLKDYLNELNGLHIEVFNDGSIA